MDLPKTLWRKAQLFYHQHHILVASEAIGVGAAALVVFLTGQAGAKEFVKAPKAPEVAFIANTIAVTKPKLHTLPWQNPEIIYASNATDWQTACAPENILQFKVNGEDVPAAEADDVLYHPASEHKIMLVAAVGRLIEYNLATLDDDVIISNDAADPKMFHSVTNIFESKSAGKKWKLRDLLQKTLDKSANDGADAIGYYIGETLIKKGVYQDDGKPYAEQRTALQFMESMARHDIKVSPHNHMVNFSGEIGWQINYQGAEDGLRKSKPGKMKQGTNIYGARDTCLTIRHINLKYPDMIAFLPDAHEKIKGVAKPHELIRVKTGTVNFDAGVRTVSGLWQSDHYAVVAMVSAPCKVVMDNQFKQRKCTKNPNRERMDILHNVFVESGKTIAEQQLAATLPVDKVRSPYIVTARYP